MSDLTDRLRRWAIATDAVPASDLMDEAADEIERLRSQPCPYVTGTVTKHCTLTPLMLTDAEREAVESAIWDYEQNDDDEDCARMVSTLRGLLERLK